MALDTPKNKGAKKPLTDAQRAALDAGRGRTKGTPNKTTTLLKEALLLAAKEAGGGGADGLVKYLIKQAEEYPKGFLPLLGKLIPLDINSHGTLDVTMKEARDAAAQAFIRDAQERAQTLQ